MQRLYCSYSYLFDNYLISPIVCSLRTKQFEGSAEVSHIGMNACATWGDVFLGGGSSSLCSDHDNPDLYKHDLKDKIICLPQTIGSSSAGTVWLQILAKGIALKVLLFDNHVDSMAACGLIMADIWQGQRIITVDQLGDEFLNSVKCGDTIKVDEDGTVTITPKGRAPVKRRKPASIAGDDQARNDLNGFVGADANYTVSSTDLLRISSPLTHLFVLLTCYAAYQPNRNQAQGRSNLHEVDTRRTGD